MYVGHIAAGFALKARFPQVPALPIMFGIGVMDIINGGLIMAGIEYVSPNPDAGPYLHYDLDFVDWDHSLLMVAIIATVWGLLFRKNASGKASLTAALVAAAAVFSHWLTDLPVHNHDLALYPYSETHFGWGLWGKWGFASWLLEGAFVALLLAYTWRSYARAGVKLWGPTILAIVLFFQLSPWLSPTQFAATLDEPAARLVGGALIAIGFIIPGALFTWMFNRADRQRNDLPSN